jgi:Pyridoxamine 5'-phosphate oxidase
VATLIVPPEVQAVFCEVRTCEFTTLAKDNTPITWPTVALYEPTQGRFVITTSIGLPHKAYNVRRTPKVALLYSDPTGSGLAAPPVVLVQGHATCPDQIVTQSEELDALGRLLMVRQPVSAKYAASPLAVGLVPDAAADLRHPPPDPLVAPRRLGPSGGRAGGRPCGLRSSSACPGLPARC